MIQYAYTLRFWVFLDRRFFNALDYSRRSAACDEQRILNCYKGIIRKYFIQKSTYPTKWQCGSYTELICHKYNETNALARRNLSLCRCVFIFCEISTFYSVGCRSPPSVWIFTFLKIQTGGKENGKKTIRCSERAFSERVQGYQFEVWVWGIHRGVTMGNHYRTIRKRTVWKIPWYYIPLHTVCVAVHWAGKGSIWV